MKLIHHLIFIIFLFGQIAFTLVSVFGPFSVHTKVPHLIYFQNFLVIFSLAGIVIPSSVYMKLAFGWTDKLTDLIVRVLPDQPWTCLVSPAFLIMSLSFTCVFYWMLKLKN